MKLLETSPWLPGVQLGGILTTQSAAYTGTAGTITNGVGGSVGDFRVIRVMCTTFSFIAVGTAPTATTSGMPMPAFATEYFVVPTGYKVSAIQSSAAGTLYVTEVV